MKLRFKPLATIAVIAFVTSFLFPGIRVAGVPLSPVSIVALMFLPGVISAYTPQRLFLVACCMLGLIILVGRNTILYGFELRSILYLLLPLSAMGAVVAVKMMVDAFGLIRVQGWGMMLCLLNIAVMVAQATNLGDVIYRLETLWAANINFIINDDNQALILWNTIGARPPGFFPTGIFASTAIYMVCRSVFLTQRKTWPLFIALLAILLTANRTTALIFLVYESVAMIHAFGAWRFFIRAFVVISSVLILFAAISMFVNDLYLLAFLKELVGAGAVSDTDSVIERLKTLEIFLSFAPEFLLFGGFTSYALFAEGHVFDSELMLRTLQFGVLGMIFMVFIILVPRVGNWKRCWSFLFFMALISSITTTFMTSIVYLMTIALYKESVIRGKLDGGVSQ